MTLIIKYFNNYLFAWTWRPILIDFNIGKKLLRLTKKIKRYANLCFKDMEIGS